MARCFYDKNLHEWDRQNLIYKIQEKKSYDIIKLEYLYCKM